MPAEIQHGQWFELTLSLFSSRHVEYTAPVRVWTDRSHAKPKAARRHSWDAEPVVAADSTVAVPGQPNFASESESLLAKSGVGQ